MKQICFFFLFLLASSCSIHAQEFSGIVTDADSAQVPFYQAGIKISQGDKVVFEGKTYFDGRFKYKGTANQNYVVTASYTGFKDSSITIKTDAKGKPTPKEFKIALKKDGLRLSGYLMGRDNDEAIKDAGIILKNVMTRQEVKIMTGIDGAYNFRLEYETNYLVRIDKRSAGIMNNYQDTSFYLSTIGFDKPLDFKLNIKLAPSTEFVKARAEYDPKQKPQNKNTKPAIEVYGAKDSVKLAQQAIVIATLNREVFVKDSLIANLDKKIESIKRNESPLTAANEKKLSAKTDKVKEEIEAQKAAAAKLALEKEKAQKLLAEKEKAEQVKQAQWKLLQQAEQQKTEQKLAADLKEKKEKAELELSAAKEREANLKKQAQLTKKEDLAKQSTSAKEAQKSLVLTKKEIAQAEKLQAKNRKEWEKREYASILKQEKEKQLSSKVNAQKEKLLAKEMALKTRGDLKIQKLIKQQQIEQEKLAKKNHSKITEQRFTATVEVKKDKKLNAGEIFYDRKDSFLTDQQIRDKQQRIYLEEKRKQEQNDKAALVKKLENIQKQQQSEQQSREQTETAQKDLMESYERKLRGEKEPVAVNENTTSTTYNFAYSNVKSPIKKITITGVVYDGESSLALANTSLTVRMLNSILSQELKSDEKGNYSFEVDSGSFYLVSFYKPGYILGKQLLDVTAQKDKTFRMADFSIVEADDFDPSEKMPIVSFAKNSSAVPFDLLSEMSPIIKMMKEIPNLRMKIYGTASYDEGYPKELSLSRAQAVAKILLNNNVPESRIKFNGYGSTKTKSGCTPSSGCDDLQLSRDRSVMYKVVKD